MSDVGDWSDVDKDHLTDSGDDEVSASFASLSASPPDAGTLPPLDSVRLQDIMAWGQGRNTDELNAHLAPLGIVLRDSWYMYRGDTRIGRLYYQSGAKLLRVTCYHHPPRDDADKRPCRMTVPIKAMCSLADASVQGASAPGMSTVPAWSTYKV